MKEIKQVLLIKSKICKGLNNKEILSLYSNYPMNIDMLRDIRAGRTWYKIKCPTCKTFH